MIQIGFDNPYGLEEDIHYFEYGEFRFKLVQTEAKWSDVILTLTPEYDEDIVRKAYRIAGEFVTALSWEFDIGMAVRPIGVLTVGAEFNLEQAEPNTFVFPDLPSLGQHGGHDIRRIGRIKKKEQRLATTLYREALSANKTTLSVLFFWQILESRGHTAVQWVNDLTRDLPAGLGRLPTLIEQIDMGGRSLGDYLLDDCRHAIAHVHREPGKRQLLFDDYDEDLRLGTSNEILRLLARYYIEVELEVSGHRWLSRGPDGFPTYEPPREG